MADTRVRLTQNHLPAVIRTLAKENDRLSKQLASGVTKVAKANAPVDTTHLQRNIRYERVGRGAYDVISDTGDATHREYAAYNEFGTRYMSAQPYMGPAAAAGSAMTGPIGVQMGRRISLSATTGKTV